MVLFYNKKPLTKLEEVVNKLRNIEDRDFINDGIFLGTQEELANLLFFPSFIDIFYKKDFTIFLPDEKRAFQIGNVKIVPINPPWYTHNIYSLCRVRGSNMESFDDFDLIINSEYNVTSLNFKNQEDIYTLDQERQIVSFEKNELYFNYMKNLTIKSKIRAFIK